MNSILHLILAQTGCDCKFNIEAQPLFCLFLPAASAAGRIFKPPASRVVVASIHPTVVHKLAAVSNLGLTNQTNQTN
jgi:hypothetical protein